MIYDHSTICSRSGCTFSSDESKDSLSSPVDSLPTVLCVFKALLPASIAPPTHVSFSPRTLAMSGQRPSSSKHPAHVASSCLTTTSARWGHGAEESG